MTIRGILLDIEGTTSSISFVHDVMFPFALKHMEQYIAAHGTEAECQAAFEQVAVDAGHESIAAWANSTAQDPVHLVVTEVRRLMASDIKATGLKAIQGLVWKQGFDSGELVAHTYPDVIPAIGSWRDAGIDVRIYSSGSVPAQKLFFGHVEDHGDCLHLFSGHYDTRIGGKKEVESYTKISKDWGLAPTEILFISDIADELTAALDAGCQVAASLRPGNAELPTQPPLARIQSFSEVEI